MKYWASLPSGRAGTLQSSAWTTAAYLLRYHEPDKAGCTNATCLRRYLPPFAASAIGFSVSNPC